MVVGDETEFILANATELLGGFISSARLHAPSMYFSTGPTTPKNLETAAH